MTMVHPDYSKLASRIEISNLHKETEDNYLKVVEALDQMTDKFGRNASFIHPELLRVVKANIDKINAKLDYSRDFNYDFLGSRHWREATYSRLITKLLRGPSIC